METQLPIFSCCWLCIELTNISVNLNLSDTLRNHELV